MSANPSRCFVPIGQWADGWFRRRTASRRCRGRNESALNMITHDQIIDDSELGTVVVRETGHWSVPTGSHLRLTPSVRGPAGKRGWARQRPGRARCMHVGDAAALRRSRQFPLKQAQVCLRHGRIYATDCAECETKSGRIDRIERIISLEGDLNAEQRAQLMEIADKCPVHHTLKSEIDIRTMEEPVGA